MAERSSAGRRVRWFVGLAALLAAGAVIVSSFMTGADDDGAAGDTRTRVTWMVGVDYTRDLIQQLTHEFNRTHPTVRLDIMWVPGPHYQQKLKTLIAAGQPPDLFYCGDVWVAYLLPFLYDLTDLMERDAAQTDLADFYPQLLDACRHNGRFYFLPRWFNISLLYYNKRMFREAGVAYPTEAWTWDDYTSAAQRLTRRGPNGRVEAWGTMVAPLWWGEWLVLVRQAGGDMFDADLTRCTLNTPEAKRGMQFYFDKVHTLGIAPAPGYEPDGAFASKRIAIEYGGHIGNWVTYNAIDGLEWDVEILPAGPATRRGGELSIDALGMSRASDNPDAAWEVVKFMSSKESIRRHVEKGFLPVRKSVAEETIFARCQDASPANARAAYRALDFAVSIPRSPDFIELALEIIQPDIDEMLSRRLSPAETCERVTRTADTYLRVVASRGASQ